MSKKRIIIVVISVILACVLGFIIYYNATEETRNVNETIEEIKTEISEYRNSKSPYSYISFYLSDDVAENEKFQEFALGQVKEMMANKEASILYEFLKEFEEDDYNYDYLKSAVSEGFSKIESLEEAYTFKNEIELLKYYDEDCVILKDSQLVKKFIEEHGQEEIHVEPGTGYYAGNKNTDTHHRVGIAGSPLSDNVSTEYYGDFKVVRKYGKQLNSYYEETSYSSYSYYFRDKSIDYDPEECSFIYSGGYLMSFSKETNELLGFEKI